MTLLTNDPMEILKRKAIIFILAVMVIGGTLATVLHSFEPKTHPISLVIPPLSTIIFLSLLIYLIKYPQQIQQVIKICLGWCSFMILFPEYFFVIESWLSDEKRLVDTLPPISSGLFLLTTGMIVFLRPSGLVRLVLIFWLVIAAPVVTYSMFHLPELGTPRGLDLIVALVPAMGINFSLTVFYSHLQDAINKLYIERFHFKEVSEKDALTGILNRGTGERLLQNLVDQTTQKIGIILCDIDHFKRVNDNYGHLMGDRVL